MAEKIKLHDFIEIDYTGRLNDGTVFDTTEENVAKEARLPTENANFKAMRICVGEKQVIPGLDAGLIDKETGKVYEVKLAPEGAFGKKDIKKMKIMPMGAFKEHNMQPQPGLQIDVDGQRGTITRVSGGRVIVNFNHPLAGREVTYKVKINRIITDVKEKISSFINTTLRVPEDKVKIEIVEKKATVELPMQLPEQFTEAIGKKLAELVGLKELQFNNPTVKKEEPKQG
jgi:FKBP-type peptidyl-prolyl cis-trans isomerase 2